MQTWNMLCSPCTPHLGCEKRNALPSFPQGPPCQGLLALPQMSLHLRLYRRLSKKRALLPCCSRRGQSGSNSAGNVSIGLINPSVKPISILMLIYDPLEYLSIPVQSCMPTVCAAKSCLGQTKTPKAPSPIALFLGVTPASITTCALDPSHSSYLESMAPKPSGTSSAVHKPSKQRAPREPRICHRIGRRSEVKFDVPFKETLPNMQHRQKAQRASKIACLRTIMTLSHPGP